jgi:hypothetical protein
MLNTLANSSRVPAPSETVRGNDPRSVPQKRKKPLGKPAAMKCAFPSFATNTSVRENAVE